MRRLRTILVLLCIILLAMTLVMWVRSHGAGEVIGREGRDKTGFVATFHGIFSGGGQLAVGRLVVQRREGLPEEDLFVPRVPIRWRWRWRREFAPFAFLTDAGNPIIERLHFGTHGLEAGREYKRTYRGVGVPYWLLALILAALPAWVIATTTARWIRRSERALRGRCTHCGYDLRGMTARCPECGQIIP